MTEIAHTKCSRCKCFRESATFLNAKGRRLKTCQTCRDRHKCNKCDAKFSSNNHLVRHKKAVHDKIKGFKCPTCNFRCSENSHLKHHVKSIHNKIKDHHCTSCDYRCSTNSDLKQHVKRIHTKIKDHRCTSCELKFSTNSDLNRHVKAVHDKIKDRHCSKCDFICSSNSTLTQHIKAIHDKIKNFICPKCDYRCCFNTTLTKHTKFCTGDLNCSSGEKAVMDILDKMKVEYIHDQTDEDLTEFCKKSLRFDFKIPMYNVVIEYNGIQHYKPQRFGGMSEEKAEAAFEKQKIHDKFKRDYCEEYAISLLEISYKNFGDIPKLVADFLVENEWSELH